MTALKSWGGSTLSGSWLRNWCLLAVLAIASLASAIDNPVSRVDGVNDCGTMKYNGEYYISGNWLAGDMLSSPDMVNWGNRKQVIWNNFGWQDTHPYDDNYIHAPELKYINGVFHYWFGADTEIGHATATNPWGPYTEPVSTEFDVKIDPNYFRDKNGSQYFYKVLFNNGNQIYGRTMSDPYTFSGSDTFMLSAVNSWETQSGTPINEGPYVIEYRDKYYMFYNGNGTGDSFYQIGVVQADTPMGFSNSGKYANAVLPVTNVGSGQINTTGQPWALQGPNGFEWWLGYFAIYTPDGGGRYQCIDRMHFHDHTMFVDGPTNRYTTGYHPEPAEPQLLSLFNNYTGPMLAEDWNVLFNGSWSVANGEASQTAPNDWTFNLVNRLSATNYLIEANVRFDAVDTEDKAGVLAYYADDNNWMIIGFDRIGDNWYAHKKEAGVDQVVGWGSFSGSMDWNAYHKIRVEKNGSTFHVLINDMTPPNYSAISTGFTGLGLPGLYADHGEASFDGVIYTIGWDEYNSKVEGWGNAYLGFPQAGTWAYASDGIHSQTVSGAAYTFKGVPMPEYEFTAQVYRTMAVPVDANPHSMGVMPVAIDANNYLGAEIDLVNNQLYTYGAHNGTPVTSQFASVPAQDNYNFRVVKLTDKIIIFIDGVEKMTINLAYGDAHPGIITQNITARFDGMLCYQTEQPTLPVGFASADIGSVGFPGKADYQDGRLLMEASGHDIWDVSDAFHYTYVPMTGDCEIFTRVDMLDPTNWWAKAGVMFRESLSNNDKMVFACLTGGHSDVHFMWRENAGWGTPLLNYNSPKEVGSELGWVKIVRKADSFSGWYSEDGLDWRYLGSCNVDMSDTVYVGLALTATDNTRVTSAIFDHIGVTPIITPNAALPSPWTLTDVGSVSPAGSADYVTINDLYQLDGGGGDTWGTADSFSFINQPASGDIQITARVAHVDWLNLAWTKAGVMIRDDLTAGSRFARMALCGNGELWAMHREPASTAVVANGATGAPYAAPIWVRVTRQGNLFTFAKSADGSAWDTVTQQTINMDANTYIGLSVNAWDVGHTRSGIFDNVSITVPPALDLTPPTPNPSTWATAPYATGSNSISMTATTASDVNGVEYYFTCTAGGGHDSGWQSSSTYVDTGLAASTQYTYTVTTRDLSPQQNTTTASSAASATTMPPVPNAASNCVASGISETQISVTWTDNSSNETGFRVERSSNGSSWSTAGTVGANVTSFTNGGLSCENTFYYRVVAYNGSGDGAASNSDTGTTDDCGGW